MTNSIQSEYYTVTQVLRGIAAVPEAMTAPRQGKWWNEATHSWVYTDLSKTEVSESDEDLLGDLKAELDAAGEPTGTTDGAVKDTYYYDMLEVSMLRAMDGYRVPLAFLCLRF